MIKFQKALFPIFVIAIPVLWPLYNNLAIRDFQELVFQFGTMALCAYFVGNLWMGLFMSWTLYLFFLNGANVGHEAVLNIFLGIMLFGISRRFFKNFRFEKECRSWMLWLFFLTCIFMLMQSVGIDPIHVPFDPQTGPNLAEAMTDPVGIFNLKAHNGIFLALFTCYAAYLNPIIALFVMALTGFSLSSGAVMGAISGFLFYTYYHSKKWFKIFAVICVLGAVSFTIKDVCFDKKMYTSRFNIWHAVVKTSLQRPIGYGPDSFRNETPFKPFLFGGDEERRSALWVKVPGSNGQYQFQYYDPNPKKLATEYKGIVPNSPNIWDNAHNEYLMVLFCFGIPGLAILYFFIREIVLIFRKAEKNKEVVLITSLLIVYAISSLTQFPLEVARLAHLFPIILGAFYGATDT